MSPVDGDEEEEHPVADTEVESETSTMLLSPMARASPRSCEGRVGGRTIFPRQVQSSKHAGAAESSGAELQKKS